MNKAWITNCLKVLNLERIPVDVSRWFDELMLKYKWFLARSPARSLLNSLSLCLLNHLFESFPSCKEVKYSLVNSDHLCQLQLLHHPTSKSLMFTFYSRFSWYHYHHHGNAQFQTMLIHSISLQSIIAVLECLEFSWSYIIVNTSYFQLFHGFVIQRV